MVHKIEYLIVDTTAFINNAPLHEIATNIVTVQDVVDEITNKRQLRRLVTLPYDLKIKDVFPESIKIITDFSKKTGDYPSLSATDIKVMALTYQLEKEKVGTEHLRQEPVVARTVKLSTPLVADEASANVNISGFYLPTKKKGSKNDEEDSEGDVSNGSDSASDDEGVYESDKMEKAYNRLADNEHSDHTHIDHAQDKIHDEIQKNTDIKLDLSEKFATLDCNELEDIIEGKQLEDILVSVNNEAQSESAESEGESDRSESDSESEYSDDDSGWITPSNIQKAKKQMDDELVEDKAAVVACITTDFAMQNVLKQINLNVAALDGRMIKQIRTFILRCHTCFKTTSLMEKVFCPKCGNKTLKKVAVSVDENGKQQIHINARRPLTGRGKKYSLPTFKGGKYSHNPVLTEDQPQPQQRPTRQARMKNNPLDPDYVAGYSPFVMRDVNSRSALLGITPGADFKHWMKKNPNEARKKRK